MRCPSCGTMRAGEAPDCRCGQTWPAGYAEGTRPKFGADFTEPTTPPRQLDAFKPELFDVPTATREQERNLIAGIVDLCRGFGDHSERGCPNCGIEAPPPIAFDLAELRALASWLEWIGQTIEDADGEPGPDLADDLAARFRLAVEDFTNNEEGKG